MPDQGFKISNEDRQQFMGAIRNPEFFKQDPQKQQQALASLPMFQRMPQDQRNIIVGGLMKHKDQIQSRLSQLPPDQATPDKSDPLGGQPSMFSKGLDAATSTFSEKILGKGREHTLQGVLEKKHEKEEKEGYAYGFQTYHKILNPVSEQAAGLLDALQTPLGALTAGFGPKIRAMVALSDSPILTRALIRTLKFAEHGVRLGYDASLVNGAIDSLKEVSQNPSVKNVSKLLVNAGMAAGVARPEIQSTVDKVKSRFSAPKLQVDAADSARPKRGAANDFTPHAKKYGVTADQYKAAHEAPLEDISRQSHEVAGQAQELSRLRRYNEQAGGVIPQHEARLRKLHEARDAAELNLQDTKTFDREIANVEGRLSAVKRKISENHSRIEHLKSENVEGQHSMYQDMIRDRTAPPEPEKQGAKKYTVPGTEPPAAKPPVEAGPKRLGPEVIDPEFVEPQPQAAPRQKPAGQPPIDAEELPALPPGNQARPGQAPVAPEGRQLAAGEQPHPPYTVETDPKTGKPVNVIQGEGNHIVQPIPGEPPQQVGRRQLEAAPSRTPEGAIISPEATEPPPAKKPIRGRLEAGPTAEPPKQLTAPKTRYSPYTVETDPETGQQVNVIQGSGEPPSQRSRRNRPATTPQPPPAESPAGQAPNAAAEAPVAAVPPVQEQQAVAAATPPAEPEKPPTPQGKEEQSNGPEKKADEQENGKKNAEHEALKGPSTLQEGRMTELPKEDIKVDPERFQFKSKAVGRSGVTDKLSDVDQIDPDRLGTLAVWKDPKNGSTYVINGHHRLELAKRAGYDKPIPVRYLDAKDAKEARTKGAVINLGEGNGDPIDAAKVFKEGGFTPEDVQKKFNLSPRNPVVKQGLALSKLSDPVFKLVANGELPEGRGAAIGELLDNEADQKAAADMDYKAEKRGKHLTDSEFREAIRLVKSAPKVSEEHQDLFGNYNTERNLTLEKGEISQYIKNQLSSDRKLFGAVSKSAAAAKLSETGNIINADENAGRADQAKRAIDIYDKLSGMSGPVSDVLNDAAKELAEGGKPGDVKQRAYERIKREFGDDISKIFGGGEKPAGGGAQRNEGDRPVQGKGVSGRGSAEPPGGVKQATADEQPSMFDRPTAEPPRSKKKVDTPASKPQVKEKDRIFFKDGDQWKLAEVVSSEGGKVMAKPLTGKDTAPIDITDRKYRKDKDTGASKLAIAGATIGLGAMAGQKDKPKDDRYVRAQMRPSLGDRRPTKKSALGSSGSDAPPEFKGLKGRYSPLGYPEYVVPKDREKELLKYYPRSNAETDLGKKQTLYTEEGASTADTQQHERIHLGQSNLKKQPTVEQLVDAFRPLGISRREILDKFSSDAAPVELPAYLFQSEYGKGDKETYFEKSGKSKKQFKEAYRNYINLLRRLNPGMVHHIEATMPKDYELEFIRNEAPQVSPPQAVMKEVASMRGEK